jgi:hypothetical protein
MFTSFTVRVPGMIIDQRIVMLHLRRRELLCLFGYKSLRYNSLDYNFGGSHVY